MTDAEGVSRELESKGGKMLESPCRRSGFARRDGSDAHELLINFLRPRYAHGILFEFVQRLKEAG